MKKIILSMAFMVAAVLGVSAQNKGEVALDYVFLRENVKVERPVFSFDHNTDSHGFAVGYTHFVGGTATRNGVVGITGEFGANIDNNEANVVTGMVGVTLKARNSSYVRPYVRALGGVARQHVNRTNVFDTTDFSGAFKLGAGIDVALSKKSKNQIHFGLDYLNTGFDGERQNGLQLSTGIRF